MCINWLEMVYRHLCPCINKIRTQEVQQRRPFGLPFGPKGHLTVWPLNVGILKTPRQLAETCQESTPACASRKPKDRVQGRYQAYQPVGWLCWVCFAMSTCL